MVCLVLSVLENIDFEIYVVSFLAYALMELDGGADSSRRCSEMEVFLRTGEGAL